ncbi:hypothetical protein BASA50_010248 [Batrachochytrium salamandrivorans]|uniref:O-acyltransferase n=1 Tax=Batrachochytrium salamandrivorans TaxID=1357716 RepID=A0ABQ8F1P6_9FUNG|nr:hypothetical protein BASA62_007130 [Batrachochytrium salamandrivorans]KAH6589083.1 hypothetical protein BASA50_010248 [Batrachochytrium salamandrivorans]KAH9273335.1 hypothetical protein BASA83_004334 [Batrachochytrium salamandrivorans]
MDDPSAVPVLQPTVQGSSLEPASPNQHASQSPKTLTAHTSAATIVRPATRLVRKGSFRSRTSQLDYETLDREQNSMRGFFTLFWVFMATYVTVTTYRNWRSQGILVSLRFYSVFSYDVFGLVLADSLMVLSLFVPVLAQIWLGGLGLTKMTWITILHVWQLFWFSTCIAVALGKDWPWIQSGAFIVHCIAMLFKQHSYSSFNIDLRFKHDRLLELRKKVAAHKKDDDISARRSSTSRSPTSHKSTSPTRHRILDSDVDAHLSEISGLEKELIKPTVSFPANITFCNYMDYLLVPTLVYELEYPRTEKFRPMYFLSKAAATACTFGLLYISYEHYIYPVLIDMPNHKFFDSVFQLLMPFMVCYLLLFYIIFECVCNAFAELTCFADREFYSDWWNSTTFDEFARKWNRPVHEFLLRHVYLESISTYRLSKTNARLVTFLLSSFVHELVILVVGKRIRFYLFLAQMSQIPLIYIAHIGFVRRQKLAGNVFFWFGMLLGPPFIAVSYMREHYA